ncbi:MAG: PqiC family protein [Thermodesulfobacteriota bacterium]
MKKRPGKGKGHLLLLVACAFILAGCARTAPVRYYQLSALTAPIGQGAVDAVIGIGPVRLPEYLDRPQLVSRLTATRLHLAESHRWAEPLAENIPRVMGENLSSLLGTDHILLHPWPASRSTDYQLLVEILHFENENNGAARLVALWSVKGKEGGCVVPERRSSHLIPATSQGREGQVDALNEALGRFCREVAEALRPLLPAAAGSR